MRRVIIVSMLAIFLILIFVVVFTKQKNKTLDFIVVDGGKIDSEDQKYNNVVINNYEAYREITDHYVIEEKIAESDFDKYDFLVAIIENDYCSGKVPPIEKIKIDNNQVSLTLKLDRSEPVCSMEYEMLFVGIAKGKLKDNPKVKYVYD